MKVFSSNDVKIYNLSSTKSLPDWLPEAKKKALLKKDLDYKKRIELIQDFDMPTVSNKIKVSQNGQYILVSGTYKPRIKCFDVTNLSLKFERCFDSEVVNFLPLSDDYTKLVFLHDDRYLEFHSQSGFYYKLRQPTFGRDLCYNESNCDLYTVGVSSNIYRLNLEQGRFLAPMVSSSEENVSCTVSPHHSLLATGSFDGLVECWDTRARLCAGRLDIAQQLLAKHLSPGDGVPEISSLAFRDALHLTVGTSSGHVLLFDIRSPHPSIVKDHLYNFPINSIQFNAENNLILSTDKKCLKAWHADTGKTFAAIEPESDISDMTVYKNSGLILMATEAREMLAHFVPALGPSPRWCSFLEGITEELEEAEETQVYDDYRFLTKQDLEGLGLGHLVGTDLVRAYMHGYFIDLRLYNKAKAAAEPFAFDEYKKLKIKEKVEEERKNRVERKKVCKVNKELTTRLIEEERSGKAKDRAVAANILSDPRFSRIFTDKDMQFDVNSEEYANANPFVMEGIRRKMELSQKRKSAEGDASSSDEDHTDDSDEEKKSTEETEGLSSEQEEVDKMKKMKERKHRSATQTIKLNFDGSGVRKEVREPRDSVRTSKSTPKLLKVEPGSEYSYLSAGHTENLNDVAKLSLEERLKITGDLSEEGGLPRSSSTRELTFTMEDERAVQRGQKLKAHLRERRAARRPTLRGMRRPKGAWKG